MYILSLSDLWILINDDLILLFQEIPGLFNSLRRIRPRTAIIASLSHSMWNVLFYQSSDSIPHPISTPTAAGIIAVVVGITLPTVAPFPKWTSGMIEI